MLYSPRIIYALLAIIFLSGLFIACNESGADTKETKTLTKEELVKKGEYLVSVMGCADCHSPKTFGPNGPVPDKERFLSGHPQNDPLPAINNDAAKSWILFAQDGTASVGPWGVSFGANLTPDETGIGTWTEEQFDRALRKGMYKGIEGTRTLLPLMPWPVYSNLKDEDVKAIFNYLKSIKPVRNIVPEPIAPDQLASIK